LEKPPPHPASPVYVGIYGAADLGHFTQYVPYSVNCIKARI